MKIEKFSDVRRIEFINMTGIVNESEIIDADTLISLTFNERTVWNNKFESNLKPQELIELCKAPGLQVKTIHNKGITGEGINIAIIDQPLDLNHPEYKNKIIKYKNFAEIEDSQMHGPAVTSILVGNTVGVAPNAMVMYASIPTWKEDAQYAIDALNWILEENELLEENKKIKFVSFSADPLNWKYNTDLWEQAVSKAYDRGIIVLDCTQKKYSIHQAYYDINDINDMQKIKPFYPDTKNLSPLKGELLVPTSRRTVAEIYNDGIYSYAYYGIGGLSWGIPYLAGTLALGQQIYNELTAEELMNLIYSTSYISETGHNFIYPENFTNKICELKNENIINKR